MLVRMSNFSLSDLKNVAVSSVGWSQSHNNCHEHSVWMATTPQPLVYCISGGL